MFVLYKHTQDDTSIIAVSESKETLTEELKEWATRYAEDISGYDEDTFNNMYKRSIEEAVDFWSDEDETYPYWLAIDWAEEI